MSIWHFFHHVCKGIYCHCKQIVKSFPEESSTCKFWSGNKLIKCFIALFLKRSEYNNSFVILGLDKGVHRAVPHTYSSHSRPSIFMAAITSQITALFLKSIPNFHKIKNKEIEAWVFFWVIWLVKWKWQIRDPQVECIL